MYFRRPENFIVCRCSTGKFKFGPNLLPADPPCGELSDGVSVASPPLPSERLQPA